MAQVKILLHDTVNDHITSKERFLIREALKIENDISLKQHRDYSKGKELTPERVIKDILDWAEELDINHASLDNARKFLENG